MTNCVFVVTDVAAKLCFSVPFFKLGFHVRLQFKAIGKARTNKTSKLLVIPLVPAPNIKGQRGKRERLLDNRLFILFNGNGDLFFFYLFQRGKIDRRKQVIGRNIDNAFKRNGLL